MRLAGSCLAHQQDRRRPADVTAFGEVSDLPGRDAGAFNLNRIQRRHARPPGLMQSPCDGPARAFRPLRSQQGFAVADMGSPFPRRGLRQAGELTANRRHAQCLAMLPDGVFLKLAHQAVPAHGADSSVS